MKEPRFAKPAARFAAAPIAVPTAALAVLVVVFVLLAAGCSSGDDDTTDSAASEEGSADDGVGSELILSIVELEYGSMLENFMPPPEYEQAVKECMRAQGFEYESYPPPEFIIPLSDLTKIFEEVASLDPTSSRFRNRYGYGISTVDAYLWSGGGSFEDPNAEMLARMAPAEQDAWQAALYGHQDYSAFEDPNYQPTDEQVEELLKGAGCVGEAQEAAGIDYGAFFDDDNDDLFETFQRIQSSEGFVELEQGWAQCAAGEGFDDLTTFDDVTSLIYDLVDEIRAPDPFADLTEEDFLTMTEEDFKELSEAMGPPYTLEDLQGVQQQELDIARRLAHCDRAYWSGFAEIEDQLSPDG